MKLVERKAYLLMIAVFFSATSMIGQTIRLADKYHNLFFDSRAGLLDRLMVNDFIAPVAAVCVCIGYISFLWLKNILQRNPIKTALLWIVPLFLIIPLLLISGISTLVELYVQNTTFDIQTLTITAIPSHQGSLLLNNDFGGFYMGGVIFSLFYISSASTK